MGRFKDPVGKAIAEVNKQAEIFKANFRGTGDKVYLLTYHSIHQGQDYHGIVSVHKTPPEIPPSKKEPCGCCSITYYVEEKELKD